jgi:thymidylate synthase (FAD)
VLDHGFIRLIDHMGSDLSVVRSARVSYDAAWRAGEDEHSDAKLIRYMVRNRHSSPFESVVMTVEVGAPIFVFRQWHRHRTWTYNELSARYRELPETFYVPEPELVGVQSTSNKQGRSTDDVDPALLERRREECEILRAQNESAFACYHDLLARGWPRELARTVLPLGTYSHQFGTVNLGNLFRFLDLRDHHHAQHEIRVYAEELVKIARSFCPVSVAAWEEYRK